MNIDFQTFLALAGILISILLFLIGYRKTIGAKKERVQTANKEIIDSLLKRLVLEDFLPNADEVERFAAGKATDYLLRSQDVMIADEIIDSLYARVLDNDFIGPEQRRKIVDRLRILASGQDEEIITPERAVETSSQKTRAKYNAFLLAFASTLAASGVVFAVTLLFRGESSILPDKAALIPVFVTFIASFATLIPIILVRRLKESQEQTTPSTLAEKYSEFEKSIAQALAKKGLKFEHTLRGEPYDFHVEGKQGDFFVELKTSLTRMPSTILRKLIDRLEERAASSNSSALIVSSEPVPDRIKSLETPHVRIIDIDEFNRLLKTM